MTTKQFGILTFSHNTKLKPTNADSSQIKPEDLREVDAGYSIFIESYEPDPDKTKHYIITLGEEAYPAGWLESFHSSKRKEWYVFKEHIEDIEGLNSNNEPKDTAVYQSIFRDNGHLLKIHGRELWSNQPILSSTPNFTWREALHVNANGTYRHPPSPGILANIERVGNVMQQIRNRYNRPISINSWYRDPVTNKRVGGASASRHLQGDAVDFVVQGLSTAEVFKDLNPWWGNKGGLAYHPQFIHIDCRGWKSRWQY